MAHTVFFSWQASRGARECRNLIEQALRTAFDSLANQTTLEEALREGLELDKDTKNVPGSPPIFSTILAKIEKAAVFVPDLTSVAKRVDGELIPNPNVLIEYGWALKTLSHSRIIPVMNIAYGNPKNERLPFDLAHLRFPITFELAEGASEADRRKTREALSKELSEALKTVFGSEEFKAQILKAPVDSPRLPTLAEKASSLRSDQEYRQDREHLLASTAEILKGVEKLFKEVVRLCEEINADGHFSIRTSATIRPGYAEQICVITQDRVSMQLTWLQPYGGSLENARLISREWDEMMINHPNNLALLRPSKLKEERFTPEISREREYGWCPDREEGRFISNEALAEQFLREFLDLLERDRTGQIHRPEKW